MLKALVFVYGLLVGSFLNVCIYRIPAGLSVVKPRSRCGSCGTSLSAIELVPVISWVLQKGRCRTCQSKVALRYPLIELLNAFVWLMVFGVYGLAFDTLIMLVFSSYLLVVAFVDIDHMLIHNKTVVFGTALGAVPLVYAGLGRYALYQNVTSGFLGACLPFLIMFFLALLSSIFAKGGAMGMGDVKIFVPIGLFLGLKLTLLALWLSFLLGGVFGLFWVAILKKDKKAMVPFGPFICLGAYFAMLYGTSFLGRILL